MFLMCFDALFILPWLLIVRAEGIVKRERERESDGEREVDLDIDRGAEQVTATHTHTHPISVSQQASTHIHFNVSLPMAQMDSAMCANCVPPTRISPMRETHSYKSISHTLTAFMHPDRGTWKALTFPGWTWQVHVEWYLVHNHRNLLVSVLWA